VDTEEDVHCGVEVWVRAFEDFDKRFMLGIIRATTWILQKFIMLT
jgi:hypothetical protein